MPIWWLKHVLKFGVCQYKWVRSLKQSSQMVQDTVYIFRTSFGINCNKPNFDKNLNTQRTCANVIPVKIINLHQKRQMRNSLCSSLPISRKFNSKLKFWKNNRNAGKGGFCFTPKSCKQSGVGTFNHSDRIWEGMMNEKQQSFSIKTSKRVVVSPFCNHYAEILAYVCVRVVTCNCLSVFELF